MVARHLLLTGGIGLLRPRQVLVSGFMISLLDLALNLVEPVGLQGGEDLI
jgi:hypothetical protein